MFSKWWLVTWTTYGTWLPGDPRGYCTWRERVYVPPPARYAKPGEEVYDRTKHATKHQVALHATEEAVRLARAQMQIVQDAIVEDVAEMPITPAIMSVGHSHIHLLAQFGGLKIRKAVGRLKSAATRKLREDGFRAKRGWTKGCDMKSKTNAKAFENAYRYVRRHREQGCLVYEWDLELWF